MGIAFYDNLAATPVDDSAGYIEVERIYKFDWTRFGEKDWQELFRIYQSLPGAVRYQSIPHWYGVDEDTAPFLSASVEPPGLQVYGVLPLTDWAIWDEEFQTKACELPIRISG